MPSDLTFWQNPLICASDPTVHGTIVLKSDYNMNLIDFIMEIPLQWKYQTDHDSGELCIIIIIIIAFLWSRDVNKAFVMS